MLHENVLVKARIRELEEQLAAITKRRGRKRKRIQHVGTIDFGKGVSHVAAEAATASRTAKRARGSGGDEMAQPTQRRCRTCGKTGHNARTCQKDKEALSESDTSKSYASSVVNSE
ncbi:hypothetical protein BKA66DRAFT_505558 [Pyrenochaeta sp. MPI-SDFR-AT-0127]|nr:hypothetical protein BKA66DRAFT_505558 [Pyrenochaeta sp. MPI-SDFR-AT-0127]